MFIGLWYLGSEAIGDWYAKGEGLRTGLCMMLPSGEASGVGGRTAWEPERQISSSWAGETSVP
jgi:hypothetical protein